MSNPPNNPLNPLPPDKGPWLYSGASQPTPSYVPPPTPPHPQPVAHGSTPSASSSRPAASPPPPPPSTGKSAGGKEEDASLASVVDTIEAIIIALILALTFRAFIIEAFVIPTGSMAPTLKGAHFNVICPKCGYAFARDARLIYQIQYDAGGRMGRITGPDERFELLYNTNIPADETDPIICPNCQYAIDPATLPQHLPSVTIKDDPRTRSTHEVKVAWANNGDRILVLKYLYSVMAPERFDVIVFKEPQKAQDNYIKRLIGLPGETIEAIQGDIFAGREGKTAAEDLVIQRKPERVQRDVWQLVHDNDFYPSDEGEPRRFPPSLPAEFGKWTNPWAGEGATAEGWNREIMTTAGPLKTVGGPIVDYKGTAPGRLRFRVGDTVAYNVLGYNDDVHDLIEPRDPRKPLPPVRVGDLRLETEWTPEEKSGCSISLTVGAPRNQVRAVWSEKGLEIERFDRAKGTFGSVYERSAAECPPPAPGRAHAVALNNVDRAARFFIDGKMAGEYLMPWTAADALKEYDEEKEGDSAGSMPEVYVDVGGACRLGHLKIFRDLYYTQDGNQGIAGKPLTLGADEFFAMGDNSRNSSDGRRWGSVFPALDDLGTRNGIVPRRYLLGKAIFVYWPAGFRFWEKAPVPLVPNTGDMRFIR